MSSSKWSWLAGIGCAAVVGPLQAQVPYLQFDIGNVEVSPGDSFSVQVQLVIPTTYVGNNVVGVNYWFATNSDGSAHIQVESGTLHENFEVWALLPSGVEPDWWPQILNIEDTTKPNSYRNLYDLGSIVDDAEPGFQGSVSPYVVADFWIKVLPTLSPGTYPLFTTTEDGSQGYLVANGDEGPTEVAWVGDWRASMEITVVPEPAEYAALTLLTLLGLAVYRRVKRLPEGR